MTFFNHRHIEFTKTCGSHPKKSMLILDGASYTENICTLGKYKSVYISSKWILRF